MSSLTKNQCRSVVYHLFLVEGWLPPGTTARTWAQVTMGQMNFDDPPLPEDPHYQKKRIAAQLQTAFIRLGAYIPSALKILKRGRGTLGELARWCHENQEG